MTLHVSTSAALPDLLASSNQGSVIEMKFRAEMLRANRYMGMKSCRRLRARAFDVPRGTCPRVDPEPVEPEWVEALKFATIYETVAATGL